MPDRIRHLCLDMQRLFLPEGPWPTPWMDRVLPAVIRVVESGPERTLFTRFMTPITPEEAGGVWQAYYRKWREVTREHIDLRLLDIVDELQRFVPPARLFDKTTYSAFADGRLHAYLRQSEVNCLIVTGAETDVCVLSTVLSGIDLGYRVIIVRDAICSSSDESHDALLELYQRRFSVQIDLVDAEVARKLLRSSA